MPPTIGDLAFERAFYDLIYLEGGYSDHPSDAGGKTCYGITEAVAREWGYLGPMRDLPYVTAKDIYRARYWTPLGLDAVAQLSTRIAGELFDTGVNMGVGTAAGFLQECLNAFNRLGQAYDDVETDGAIGGQTLEALGAYLAWRKADGETVLLRALNSLQGARYLKLTRQREENEDFVFGWFLQRVEI